MSAPSRPTVSVTSWPVRRRNYRGESSHGLLCSLDELHWTRSAPDQVALLRDVQPGTVLDNHPDWRSLVASPSVSPDWIVR